MGKATSLIGMVGAILLGLLLVSIGMFMYNKGMGSATSSLTELSHEEITAFNAQFDLYVGKQRGTSVATLVKKIISTSNLSSSTPERMPSVTIADKLNQSNNVKSVVSPKNMDKINDYVEQLNAVIQNVEDKHTYKVEVNYATSGLINEFIIYY